MIKRQLNPLRIGKGLLCLLALFMMLLAPQGAWAEDYGLSVAGVAVTSDNASEITGANITGTVNYNPESHTLTLYDATINGSIVSNSGDDLVVQLSGTNTINTNGVAFQQDVTTSPSPSLTFTSSYSGFLLTNVSSIDKLSSGFSGPYVPEDYIIATDANKKLCVAEYFGVKLFGQFGEGDPDFRYVTAANCNKLVTSKNSNNEEVIHASYDKYDKKLTFNNLTEDIVRGGKIANGSSYFVESEDEELNIYLVGENTFKLYSDNDGPYNVYFAKCSNINFTTDVTPGSLKITNENTYSTEVSPFDGEVTYSNHLGYSNEDITGGSGKYHYVQLQGIGLTVAGIEVTADNASHILGNDNETVSFDATTNTLTLNDAHFNGNIQWASTNTLTVKILGNNSIDATTSYLKVFEGNINANLAFTSGNTTPGTLLLTSCYHNQNVLSGWKNGSSAFYNKGVSSGDAYGFDWWAFGISDQTQILFNNKYDLWVNGLHICDAQNEQYFDVDNEQSDYFYFDGSNNTLTFNNMAVNTTQDPFIKNGLSSLTINLIGANTVGCETLFLTNNGGQTNNNITFTTQGTTSGSLVITTTRGKDDAWYTGHNEPTATGLVFTDEMKNSVRTLTFSEPTSYNLTVAGVPVTSLNADNVLGDELANHSVSFTPAVGDKPAILTLNNATIDLTDDKIEDTHGIKYTGTRDLIIKLIGTNIIQTNRGCNPIIYYGDESPKLTFESGSYPCSLELSGGNSTAIKLFDSVLGVNGINSEVGNYLTISNSEAEVMYNSTNGLYTDDNTPVTSVTISSIPDYGITVAGVSVSYANADDVLSDGTNTTDPTVTYDAESNTLSLNNATINGDIVYSSDSENPLWVNLYGTNTVNRITYTGQQEVSLYVRKAETTTVTHSLTVTGNNTDAVISGFENAQLEDEYYDIELGLYWKPTITNNIMTSLVITSNPFEGTGTSSSPYVISSAEQLIAFAKMYNGGQLSSQYCYVELSKDIDCSGLEDFEPIGLNQENPFYGNFNGGNHKIIGLSFLGGDNYYCAGLFGVIGDEYGSQSDFNYYVGNLELMNCSFTSNSHAGAIAGMLEYGTIENCKVTGTTAVNGGSYAGAIVGQYSDGTLTNNTYEYSVTTQVTDASERTGYASRGTGDDQDEDGNFDVTTGNGAVLYTKTLSTGTVSNATLEVWYPSQNGYNENGKFAPTQDAFISVTPSAGYLVSTVTVTYTENNVQKTITPELDEEKTGDGAYIYSFEMPDADATANATVTFDISSEAFAASIANATYTGSALTPTSVSLTPASGGDAIVLTNTDFTITGYQKGETSVNSPIDAGEYTVSIEGSGNYSGTRTVSYTIDPATITEVTLDKTSMPYSGAAQTVAISSVKAGDLVLGADDYTVTLNEVAITGDIQATAVGEYTVAVTGQGNFTGTESATFSIVNRTLADNEVTFYNNWATYYSAVGDVMLPTDKNIGAFVATGIGDGVVSVSQISYIPKNVPVFLNNATENVSTVVFDKDKDTNLLEHTDKAINANTVDAVYYGLHNGKMMRVSGTIPAGKNYIKILTAVINQPHAPELSFVFEGDVTGVNDVRSKKADVSGDVYDLQGRKMQKLSKKGLYISNGRKVVVK